jgi:hypothetical protein
MVDSVQGQGFAWELERSAQRVIRVVFFCGRQEPPTFIEYTTGPDIATSFETNRDKFLVIRRQLGEEAA